MVLLDTDVVSHLLRGDRESPLVGKLRRVPTEDRYISAITVGELLYGLERSGRHEHIRARLEAEFISRVTALPFDVQAARVYARIKADLHRRGEPLSEPDLRIASIALANGLILITGNDAHFRRVEGLRVENWVRG